jgi:hypothetical protein
MNMISRAGFHRPANIPPHKACIRACALAFDAFNIAPAGMIDRHSCHRGSDQRNVQRNFHCTSVRAFPYRQRADITVAETEFVFKSTATAFTSLLEKGCQWTLTCLRILSSLPTS